MTTRSGSEIKRRTALGFMGLGALGLSACQIDSGQGSNGDSSTVVEDIEFPDFDDVPEGDLNFRWVDSGDLKAVFIRTVLDAYQEKYPNVTTTYDGSGWANVSQVVPLGIRNGSAHDIFALPPEMPAQVAVNEGYVRPLEDVVPDFEAWRDTFPDTAFVPGVHIFDDQIYSWPLNSQRRLDRMLFYSVDVMAEAGYEDPGSEIRTWDELREAARAVTATGTPGLAVDGETLDRLVMSLAHTAGWQAPGTAPAGAIHPATGEYEFDAPEVLEAIEFLQAMIDDGSIIPGFLTLEERDARAQMPSGAAGMILNGPWDIPAWKEQSPDWAYGISRCPTPNGDDFIVPYRETGANMSWVYSETRYPEVAGHLISYMGSIEGQAAMVALSEGNLQSVIAEANEFADQSDLLDDNAQMAVELADATMRIAPQVELRNPASGLVRQALEPVQPGFGVILEGIFAGQIDDPRQALIDYNSEMNAAMDRAIDAVNADGVSISREEYVFANWDPSVDYTAADYDEL